MNFTFEVPIPTPSTSNLREHWAVKSERTRSQRDSTALMFPRVKVRPLLRVTLTRVSPRELDDDNLRGALKAIRDEVARCLKVDDRTPLIVWDYAQAKGKPGEQAVRVSVEVLP